MYGWQDTAVVGLPRRPVGGRGEVSEKKYGQGRQDDHEGIEENPEGMLHASPVGQHSDQGAGAGEEEPEAERLQ